MHYSIKLTGNDPFFTLNELPVSLASFDIPGSSKNIIESNSGLFLIQEINLNHIEIYYSVFQTKADTTLLESFDRAVTFLRINLNNPVNNRIKNTGDMFLKKNQYNIIFSPDYFNIFHFPKNTEYKFLTIVYSYESITHGLSFYPVFETFHHNMLRHKTALLCEKEIYANAKMLDAVFNLLHAPYAATINKFHTDICKQLLLLALENISVITEYQPTFTLINLERIHAAKEFIDNNMPHHFTIHQIANKLKINERVLKQGFMQLYGIGLYGYLRRQIIEVAKNHLEQTDKSIKEIAILAHFKSQSNFATAFKKKFGKTPVEWRDINKRKTE